MRRGVGRGFAAWVIRVIDKMDRRDFTLPKYAELLKALKENGYSTLIPYEPASGPGEDKKSRTVILRHDIDKRSGLEVRFAELEAGSGFRAIYYFRKTKNGFQAETIKKVLSLTHEIGYHYESLAKEKGNYLKALELFSRELNELRAIAPVRTICMHGSPLKKWDNKKLWERYDYHDFGLEYEPYLDTDFDEVLYLTDTGRTWDGQNVSLRDKASAQLRTKVRSTDDIIRALNDCTLPAKLLITCHPHRWEGSPLPWLKELIWQNIKNIIKGVLVFVGSVGSGQDRTERE
jgi:hypothetical protein